MCFPQYKQPLLDLYVHHEKVTRLYSSAGLCSIDFYCNSLLYTLSVSEIQFSIKRQYWPPGFDFQGHFHINGIVFISNDIKLGNVIFLYLL